MKLSRIVMVVGLVFVAAASVGFARSMLERKMFYRTAAEKSGETLYWYVYMGQSECTVNRKYPGEEIKPITGNMNFSLLSSGYIEGTGYSAKGKIDCLPGMKIRSDLGERIITIDSIDCIFDFGAKVRTTSGETGDLIIDAEGQPKNANRFILTEYKLQVIDGEKELKKTGEDTPLSAIAFSKDGLQRAIKAMAGADKPPETK